MSAVQHTPGRFVWRELMSRDTARAQVFYSELFGWTTTSMDMGPAGTYVAFQNKDRQIAGLWPMRPEMEAPSFWTSYVSVPDVDASVEAARKNGGQVFMGPDDAPGVGRFAVVGDPDGAVFALLRSVVGDSPVAVPQVGEFCWESLTTKDIEKAKTFYGAVAGWKAETNMGMTTFGVGSGPENQVADIQTADNAPPSWVTYVVVPKLEASRDRAVTLGAQVLVPLIEIPGVGRFAFIADPTGAAIGLFEDQAKT